MHNPDQNTEFYPHLRRKFQRDLWSADLRPLEADSQLEYWAGRVHVDWIDPITEEYCDADHAIVIVLPQAFPFEAPWVLPNDAESPISNARHQMPWIEGGPLCLWPSQDTGWIPSITADELLERIRTWFIHYHQNDWPANERPPDLHLYFSQQEHHALMVISNDWKPPVEANTGRFGVWQKDANRAFAGSPTVGVVLPPKTHPDRLLLALSMSERNRDHTGIWFRLHREPCPQSVLSSLLVEIDTAAGQVSGWSRQQLCSLFGDKIRKPKTRAIIALGYPDSLGIETWIFLTFQLSFEARFNFWKQKGFLKKVAVKSYETAPADHQALLRRTGHIAAQIDQKKVIIFGQGSVGGSIALILAKSGLQHIKVVDSDVLRPGNAVRHIGGIQYTGFDKTEVAKFQVKLHAPDCNIITERISWKPFELISWISEVDLVIDATANTSFSLLLNQLCIKVNCPAIFATAHRRALIGRVRVVRPGKDACLVCYSSYYYQTDEYPTIPSGDEGEFMENGCGVPTVEASAVDIESVANWSARTALWLIRGIIKDQNHCLIINDVLPEAQGILSQIGVHWQNWSPIPNCDSCRQVQEQDGERKTH